MKAVVLWLFAAILTTVIASRHGTTAGSRDGRIIGGYDARPLSHPYLVSLQMRFLWVRTRLCSASLLTNRWILTAGHCVKGESLISSLIMSWLAMEAVVGTNDLEQKDSTAQTVRIAERIPHPSYNGGIGAYDIAMLKTARDIEYNKAVSPIEVPFSMGSLTYRTQNLILAGWGVLKTTPFIPDLPDKLQEARVEYLSFEECNKAIDAIKEPDEINPLDRVANICSGPITGGIAACSGDSGGPLIQYISYNDETTEADYETTTDDIDDEDTTTAATENSEDINKEDTTIASSKDSEGISSTTAKTPAVADIVQSYKDQGFIPVVIGVVSWGISPCGEVGAPTVYTNVSTYADFIYKNLYN